MAVPASFASTMAATDPTAQSSLSKFKLEPDGSLKRPATLFREFIAKGGKYEPEAGRYHLYISYACPWAHRTLIVRHLKGLQDIISVTATSPYLGEQGWPFGNISPFPGAQEDEVNHASHVKDIYLKVDPNYPARFSVPVLWCKSTQTIVNNESSEIIRMFNSAFNDLLPEEYAKVDLYPTALRSKIDETNEWVYDTVNNGVYKAGVTTNQSIYEDTVLALFASLDRIEVTLKEKDYLTGSELTEADIRLFTTIIRFDSVYYHLFKCNIRNIRDGYPSIHLWLRKLYWTNEAFRLATNFDHIKTHYFWSFVTINPNRIIPAGPDVDIRPL